MNREAWESVIVSDRAAAALATRVDRDIREERGLWQRYLAFLDGEGFDGRSRMIAERVEADDVRRDERLFTMILIGLLTACLLGLAFARGTRITHGPRTAEPVAIEISVMEPGTGTVAPRL